MSMTTRPNQRNGYLEYQEELDEAFDVAEMEQYETPTTAGEVMAETDEAPEDEDTVSSEDPAGGEVDTEPPVYGAAGAPPETAGDLTVEPVSGYNESLLEMDRETVRESGGAERLLDAWYAEFADSTTVALALRQPNLAQEAAEVVIGADDRIRITPTTSYPWRAICSLVITAKDGSRWIGTGWMVAPRTVITAGHCVYMHDRGGWVKSIEVIPGRDGASRPYGSYTSSNLRSVKGWTQSKKRSHDYGAIILPKNSPVGNQTGYFGYANLSLVSLLGLNVNLSGYPGDKPAGTQWFHARRVHLVTARTLVYNIDTFGGQSGAPVWRLKDGKRHVVGIHTNGSPLGNSATRIVEPVFDNIKKWKAEGM